MKHGLNERWFAGFAGMVLLLSVLGFGYLSSVPDQGDKANTASSSAEDYANSGEKVSVPVSLSWPAPQPMSRGENWLYDLFTPPEVYYDEASGRFRVTPSSRKADIAVIAEPADDAMAGLILHSVEREPFPLQLIGFVGEPGNFLGTFENRVTHETLLLREGARVGSLKMRVREFRVEQIAREIPDSMTVRENQAVAVIADERTETETVLRQGEMAYTDGRIAQVSVPENDGQIFTVVDGELIDSESGQFRIEKIRLAPPEVDVTKEKQPDGISEPMTLRPQATTDYPHDEE